MNSLGGDQPGGSGESGGGPVNILDIAAALRHLRRADPRMAALIKRHGPPSFRRTRNVFRSVAEAIFYQQLHGKAAETILRRFRALYPHGRFPTPAEVLGTSMERLRSVGLSRQKASYLLDLAAKSQDGTINPRGFARMSDEEVAQALIQVKGIGPWSADMFLMFDLNRPDVLPVGDLGVRKGFQQLFGLSELPGPEDMRRLAEPWRPYRSVAVWYLWRVVEGE